MTISSNGDSVLARVAKRNSGENVTIEKYHWRVLQLLPGAERPSYAGLRVDVLERADGS